MQHWGEPDFLLFLLGGKTIVGALLGGWIAVECTKRALGIRRSTGDLYVLPLVVGIALGRVGCFLAGLEDGTHGLATSLPFGLEFGDGVARHPVRLYEILGLGLIALVLVRRPAFLRAEGARFRFFLAAYLALARRPGLPEARRACAGALGHPVGGAPRTPVAREQRGGAESSAGGGASMTTRPYLYYDLAVSLCATCLRRVDAKVVIEDGAVFFLKRCPEHGSERVLVADDATYWRAARERWLKPGDLPRPLPDRDTLRLPVRLRSVSRPRAARLRVDRRADRPLQPGLPDLLRRERAHAARLSLAGGDRGDARRRLQRRGRARRRAALGRRADASPRVLPDRRGRSPASDPAPDGEHQRRSHRPPTPRSPSSWRSTGPASRSISSSTPSRSAPWLTCAARICATFVRRRSSDSTSSASPPRWSSR